MITKSFKGKLKKSIMEKKRVKDLQSERDRLRKLKRERVEET